MRKIREIRDKRSLAQLVSNLTMSKRPCMEACLMCEG